MTQAPLSSEAEVRPSGGTPESPEDALRAMIANAPRPRGSVRVSVDIDPQSFL